MTETKAQIQPQPYQTLPVCQLPPSSYTPDTLAHRSFTLIGSSLVERFSLDKIQIMSNPNTVVVWSLGPGLLDESARLGRIPDELRLEAVAKSRRLDLLTRYVEDYLLLICIYTELLAHYIDHTPDAFSSTS